MMSPHEQLLDVKKLQDAYKKAKTRFFFLDYDGTLVSICSKPEDATPTRDLIKLLTTLSSDPRNKIYIVSGRDRKFLDEGVGNLSLGLSAEHGAFIKPIGKNTKWTDVIADKHLDLKWKDDILAAFKKFCDQVPNSFVERKEYAITLHYRNSEKEVVKPHKRELQKQIEKLSAEFSTLDVRKGKKSLEARVAGITKGFVIKEILSRWVDKEAVDFVICIGDDVTDEDMFKELASESQLRNVFTCTVGKKAHSQSTAYLAKQTEVLDTLRALTEVEVTVS